MMKIYVVPMWRTPVYVNVHHQDIRTQISKGRSATGTAIPNSKFRIRKRWVITEKTLTIASYDTHNRGVERGFAARLPQKGMPPFSTRVPKPADPSSRSNAFQKP